MNNPLVIAALALAAERNGGVGVRIDGPDNIAATRRCVGIPILGIEKVGHPGSEVYITPTFDSAERIAAQSADIIALDATLRPRPGDEKIGELVERIHSQLRLPVMADISTLDEGLHAAQCGADLIATTLCGYTAQSAGQVTPAFDLTEELASRLTLPIILEGGLSSPEQVRRAFDSGAFAVVVGTALTGVDHLIRSFVQATPRGARQA